MQSISHFRGKIASAAILVALTVAQIPAHAQTYDYNLFSSPTALSFNWTAGSSLPVAQTVSIGDTSPCPPLANVPMCHWPVTLMTDQSWISVNSSAGATSLTTSVTVNPVGLAPGVHTGNIIATASQLTGSPIRIPVTLTVVAITYNYNLFSSPASLSFSWTAGLSLPAAQSVAIGDTSPCPPQAGVPLCHWPTVLTTDQAWISVSSSSGTTSLITSVTVDPTGLAPGVHTGNVIATATQLTGSPIRIPVVLNILGGGPTTPLTANPTSLNFGGVTLGSSSTLSTTLTNNNSSNVTISTVSLTGPGLTVSGVSSGQIVGPNQTATLAVTFAPSATGKANGSVTVTSSASSIPTIVTASGVGTAAMSHSVLLGWTSSTSAVAGYKVYRGTVSGGPYTAVTTNLNVLTSFTDTNVTSGTTYYYVVTAVDATGDESAYSEEVSATVP